MNHLAIAFSLCATALAALRPPPQFPIWDPPAPHIPFFSNQCRKDTACIVTGCCSRFTSKCVLRSSNECVGGLVAMTANLSLAEKFILSEALRDEVAAAQPGISCAADSECKAGTCCSTDGRCAIQGTSQCGGPLGEDLTSPPSTHEPSTRLGSFCDLSSACESGCCSRLYGICMLGEGGQCIPPILGARDEL